MKRPDSPYTPPNQNAGKPQGRLDEARELFETAVGEATLRAERESETARSRGPVARVLLALTIVAVILAAATLVYGIYTFPDAPIRATANGYTGKGGTPRTQEDFAAFVIWKTAIFTIVPSVFVLGFAFAMAEARQRRRRA